MKTLADLSVEQLLFINSYIEHRDWRRAVVDSGYVDGGHAAETAEIVGKRWLEDETIKAEIDRRLRVQAMAVAVTSAEIVDELRKVAFFDPRRMFNEDGTMKSVHELDSDEAAALAHFELVSASEGGIVTKMTPSSKLKALELLGKHRKMFVDQVEHSAKGKSFFGMTWLDASEEGAEDKAEDKPE